LGKDWPGRKFGSAEKHCQTAATTRATWQRAARIGMMMLNGVSGLKSVPVLGSVLGADRSLCKAGIGLARRHWRQRLQQEQGKYDDTDHRSFRNGFFGVPSHRDNVSLEVTSTKIEFVILQSYLTTLTLYPALGIMP
jgi:hypothetical protein